MATSYQATPVAAAFHDLLTRIQLTPSAIDLYESHRASVRAALKSAEDFELNRLEPIGSYARQTAICDVSDMDLLAPMRAASISAGGYLYSSTTVLSKVRGVLAARFPRTEVVRDGQAVVVDFGDGLRPMDVVPAVWNSAKGLHNYPVFDIPDGRGGWMQTSPGSHNRYLRDADIRARGKLTYASQLMKFWCATRATPIPLNGFHIEMVLAASAICEGARSYAWIIREALALLASRACADLNDPVGISGRIPAVDTQMQRLNAYASVRAALSHADSALFAERLGRGTAALQQWDFVFNGMFAR
jgi:hypothetical protein